MGILRKIRKILVSSNPTTQHMDLLNCSDELHTLSDQDGSLESLYLQDIQHLHCGCFAQPGGRCMECGQINCVLCFQHCGGHQNQSPAGCGKPICREHTQYLLFNEQTRIPFCTSCAGKLIRQKNWRLAGRILLGPFIKHDDHHES